MSKQIAPVELAEVVATILNNTPDQGLAAVKAYASFMEDLAELVCKHFDGEVNGYASAVDVEWFIGIQDAKPNGVWAKYDPEADDDWCAANHDTVSESQETQ